MIIDDKHKEAPGEGEETNGSAVGKATMLRHCTNFCPVAFPGV